MTRNQKLLSECYEELKQDIPMCTAKELADKYDVSRDYIITYIKQNEELNELYSSNKRRKYLYEVRNNTKKKKYKERRTNVHLFNKRLDKSGVVQLAEAVMVRAIKDRDTYFFNSSRFEFWQQYTVSQKSKEYYLDCIGRLR